MAFLVELGLLLVAVGFLLYYMSKRGHSYWKQRGVPTPTLLPFAGTHLDLLLFRKSIPDFFSEKYKEFPDEPLVGMLQAHRPTAMIRDPELIKHVLTKDFVAFPDRGIDVNEKTNPLSAHLFALGGARWKSLRVKLSPTFTTGKMKRMFPLMVECCNEVYGVLDGPASRGETLELKDVLARLTTDIIGSCAFGVNCNSLKDPDAEFRHHGKLAFAVTTKGLIRQTLFALVPKIAALWKFRKETDEFFLRSVKETINFREENNIKRNDFMDLLIEIKKRGKITDHVDLKEDPFLHVPVSAQDIEFTDNLMAAQAFVFFVAGFETSSTTLSFCLTELAHNVDIQKKVQEEVDAQIVKHGSITYEAIQDMTYMDKVVAETLRKYPPGAILMRKSARPFQVPDSNVVLEAGTRIVIPVFAIHNDPQFYPEPERFDPERFSPEEKNNRHHYTYLPFGEGPRICIGMRFGLVQTKVALATVMSRYKVEPLPNAEWPLKFQAGSLVTSTADGCNLRLKYRGKPALAS